MTLRKPSCDLVPEGKCEHYQTQLLEGEDAEARFERICNVYEFGLVRLLVWDSLSDEARNFVGLDKKSNVSTWVEPMMKIKLDGIPTILDGLREACDLEVPVPASLVEDWRRYSVAWIEEDCKLATWSKPLPGESLASALRRYLLHPELHLRKNNPSFYEVMQTMGFAPTDEELESGGLRAEDIAAERLRECFPDETYITDEPPVPGDWSKGSNPQTADEHK